MLHNPPEEEAPKKKRGASTGRGIGGLSWLQRSGWGTEVPPCAPTPATVVDDLAKLVPFPEQIAPEQVCLLPYAALLRRMATRHPGISQDLQVLLDAPFFSGLPPQRVGEIVSKGRVIQKRKHGWFFRQDEPATHFYLLVSGGAKICKTTADGEEVLLRIMSPLEIFGYRSINPNGKQLVAIQAAEDSRAVAWTGAAMRRLFLEHPRLALNAFNIAASFMQEFEHRYSELVTEPLEKRIARILLDLAGRMGRNEEGLIVIAEGVLKKDVGRMVGASIFSVSRVFAAWTRQGILQRARGRILLRDMASLQRIAASIVAAIGVMAAHS